MTEQSSQSNNHKDYKESNPNEAWKKTPDRGSLWLIELITWIILHFGRTTGRIFLYPIVLYFIIFSSTTVFSRNYLNRSLQRKATFKDLFKHYYSFANMLLDRVYILSGKTDSFNIRVHHSPVLTDLIDKDQGAILLGSHLGNFDLLRVYSSTFSPKTKALINIDNTQKINQVFDKLNPSLKDEIIHIGAPGAMLAVQEYVEDGYVIGILADRVEAKNRSIECDFLGEKALFPTGPIQIASLLKVPVILCFGLHSGGNNYDIYFHKFSECINLSNDRKLKQEEIASYTQSYVNVLETYCLKTPYNWYNFYDVWNSDTKEKSK